MKLFKNHDNDRYTLLTHDYRLYGLIVYEKRVISKYVGKVAKTKNLVINGKLLKDIPNFLKSICFKLNKKPQENGTSY